MKCPKCHFENPADTRFCGNCAAPLTSAQEIAFSKTMTVQQPSKFISTGTTLAGKYKIIEPIGKGGMGVVYKAEDIKLKRTVALKFLPPDLAESPEASERFLREAQAAAALSHPHICTIHEINEEEKESFIVMEYIEGQNLKQKIAGNPLEQAEALDIAIQVAEGLAEAHKKGIIHRDIKPGNVMMTAKGQAKVMDFGLAKLLGQSLITKEAKTIGTAAYMSPEQVRGEALDHRTDIWSLGVVLYEMLTGQIPFKGEYEQSLMFAIVNKEPEPVTKIRPDLPMGLGQVISKALEKNPADRYQSMEKLREDLEAVAAGLKPVKAKPTLFNGRILGIKKAYVFSGLACLVVFIALALIFLVPKRGQVFDSIAVLPLENLSGDPQQIYFSDGMHEALITELSKFKAIKVTSRTSVMRYKKTKMRIPEIAKELGVAAIVEGSTVRSGNTVRINVQLIDGRSDNHIWADNFDREYQDILTLQSEAALAIAKKIQVALTPEEAKLLARVRTVNPEANEAYLKGRYFINMLTPEDTKKGIQYLEQAIAMDPNYAPAYTGLAEAYDNLIYFGLIQLKEGWQKVKEESEKALNIDESLGEAHLFLAEYKLFYEWEWEGAEREYNLAIKLNPNNSLAHAYYAIFLAAVGKSQEALDMAQRAKQLDPLSPATDAWVGSCYWMTREYDKAIDRVKEMLKMEPNSPSLHQSLGSLYLDKKMIREALAEYRKAAEYGEVTDVCGLACTYALSGYTAKAREILNDVLQQPKEKRLESYFIAKIYTVLGEKDKAFEYLERAYEERSIWMIDLGVDAAWDFMRSDPRFITLLKKVGLEN